MYEAEGDKVYVIQDGSHENSTGKRELFLTVHPTESGSVTVEMQARALADLLNEVAC